MNIWDIIYSITVSYLLLLAISLIGKSGLKSKSHNLFAVYLIVQSSCILNTFLWRFFAATHTKAPYLFYIADTILFLWGPALYLYIKSYTNPEFRFTLKSLLHIIPFLVHGIIMISMFHQFNSSTKTLMLKKGVLSHKEEIASYIAFHFQMLVYLMFSGINVKRYHKRISREWLAKSRVYLNWLVFVLAGYFIIWLLDVSYQTIHLLTSFSPYFFVKIVYPIVFMLVFIIMLKGLKNPMIFAYQEPGLKEKYSGSNLKADEKKAIYDNIIAIMNEKKLYREPSLSLSDLAKELSVLPKHLSQVINEYFNMNFFDFINDYRIRETKLQLSQLKESKKTILEILYDTGFNSKSSFNKAFRKNTGISPTEYRRAVNA